MPLRSGTKYSFIIIIIITDIKLSYLTQLMQLKIAQHSSNKTTRTTQHFTKSRTKYNVYAQPGDWKVTTFT